MKYMGFTNISSIQFFYNGEYDDIISSNDNSEVAAEEIVEETIDIPYKEDLEKEDLEISDNNKKGDIADKNNNTKVNMEYLDDRDEDILIDSSPFTVVKSQTLDICPNTPEIPTGITDGVIAKVPVVLAQLVVPLNVTSTIDLPKSAFEIKDIKKKLRLTGSTLLQPTNILYLKGFINKSIEYSTINHSNSKAICGRKDHYAIDIPFECSTPITFFTEPLDIATNTREILQYNKSKSSQSSSSEDCEIISRESSGFNQINQQFYNERPYCKLLSSKIIEFDEYIKVKDSKENPIQIQESMVIELRIEILQNQPIVILPASKGVNEI